MVRRPYISLHLWANELLGSAIFHGPSSVYSTDLFSFDGPCERKSLTTPNFGSDYLRGPIIHECLALCFRWQYFCTTMIDQDAFLKDFLNNPHTGAQCSPALIYSLCALGALMSSDKNTRDLADGFSESAYNALITCGDLIPHTTSVQAFLCCAMFEFSRGNVSKGSMCSGQ
jgi:hypothetical protein